MRVGLSLWGTKLWGSGNCSRRSPLRPLRLLARSQREGQNHFCLDPQSTLSMGQNLPKRTPKLCCCRLVGSMWGCQKLPPALHDSDEALDNSKQLRYRRAVQRLNRILRFGCIARNLDMAQVLLQSESSQCLLKACPAAPAFAPFGFPSKGSHTPHLYTPHLCEDPDLNHQYLPQIVVTSVFKLGVYVPPVTLWSGSYMIPIHSSLKQF